MRFLFERLHARSRCSWPGRHYEIIPRSDSRQLSAHDLAQPALDTVARHRVSNTATHRKTNTCISDSAGLSLRVHLRDVAQREQ